VARHATVEIIHAGADRFVELGQREELGVPQLGDDPARGDLHGRLDLRLVARLFGARWNNGGVVVPGKSGVGAIDRRLVEARLGDACLQIVGHDHAGRTTIELECPRVRTVSS